MIFEWLGLKTLGLSRWLWVLALIAAVLVLIAFAVRREAEDDKANQTIGATAEREKTNVQVIENVGEANAAREEIRAPGPVGDCARYAICLQSARDSSQCQRFLPNIETGHGCSGPRPEGK